MKILLMLIILVCMKSFSSSTTFSNSSELENDKGLAADEEIMMSNLRGYLPAAKLWPYGVVWYQYDRTATRTLQDIIIAAIKAIQDATDNVVWFREDNVREKGVILIVQDYFGYQDKYGKSKSITRCYSDTGYYPDGNQILVMVLNTGRTCAPYGVNAVGRAVHLLLQAIGLGLEYQRDDRSKFIELDEQGLKKYYNYTQADYDKYFRTKPQNTYGLPYNFKSIMNFDFGQYVKVKPNAPVKPIGKPSNMGQFCAISQGDRNLIERMYAPLSRAKNATVKTYKGDKAIPETDCLGKIKIE